MNHLSGTTTMRVIRHGHTFCGGGFGAKGFNKGRASIGNMKAKFECVGGIDNSPAAIRDFDRHANAKGTVLDLFTLDQYIAFHGHVPPADWREASIDNYRGCFQHRPHIMFLSAPCKGFSGLLAESMSKTAKYQALNGLTLRGVWLMCEAFKDDPIELIVFENVPRIMQRGRHLLDQIVAILRSYGYAVAETTHDCGELGNLAQTRKRFLLVARHMAKVPPFLYEPPKRPLRGVGEVLDRLPVPGFGLGGPMHRMPSLQWKTWVRLAFVEAGSDWRSLNKLKVADGVLTDFGIVPAREWNNGSLGVTPWTEHASTVTANGRQASGSFSVADPRFNGHQFQQYGVRKWEGPTGTVSGQGAPGGGANSVADPRPGYGPSTHQNVFRIVRWDRHAGAVTAAGHAAGGALSVADPRSPERDGYKATKYRITGFHEPAGAVIGASTTGNGAFAVADPRAGHDVDKLQGNWRIEGWHTPARAVVGNRKSGAAAVADPRYPWKGAHENKMCVLDYDQPSKTVTTSDRVGSGALSVADPRPVGLNRKRDSYKTQGHYGVVPWDAPSRAVPGFAKKNNGFWNVADPRGADAPDMDSLPVPETRLIAVIRALDGTWHRPFTTLELAALQGLFDPEETFELDGLSDSAWRERIGNAVPPPAARAIADEMGRTLLLAWAGETFALSASPIWVQPMVIGLMAAQGGEATL